MGCQTYKQFTTRTLSTDNVVEHLITESHVINFGYIVESKKRNHKVTLMKTFSFRELNQKRCVKLQPTTPFKKT